MFVLRRLWWVLPWLFLTLADCSWAEPVSDPSSFIRSVLNRHPAVLKSRKLVRAAEYGLKGSGLQPNPVLTLAGTAGDAGESSNALTQTFEISGQPGLRRKQSSARLDSARNDLKAARRAVAADAYRAWLNYWKAERLVQLASLRTELLSEVSRASKRRYEVGEISQNESLRVELAAVQASVSRTRAEADLSAARQEISILLNLGPDLDYDFSSPPEPHPVLESTGLSEILESVSLHPEILSLQKEADALDLSSDLIGKERAPTLGLSVYRSQLFKTAGVEQGTQLSLSWPVFDWGSVANRQKQAEEKAEAYKLSVEEVVLQRRRDVSRTWALLEAARSNWFSLETQAARYEELAREARIAYDLGMLSLTDVLQTEASFRDARVDLLQAKAELFELELVLLEKTGLTWPDSLGAVDKLEEDL